MVLSFSTPPPVPFKDGTKEWHEAMNRRLDAYIRNFEDRYVNLPDTCSYKSEYADRLRLMKEMQALRYEAESIQELGEIIRDIRFLFLTEEIDDVLPDVCKLFEQIEMLPDSIPSTRCTASNRLSILGWHAAFPLPPPQATISFTIAPRPTLPLPEPSFFRLPMSVYKEPSPTLHILTMDHASSTMEHAYFPVPIGVKSILPPPPPKPPDGITTTSRTRSI